MQKLEYGVLRDFGISICILLFQLFLFFVGAYVNHPACHYLYTRMALIFNERRLSLLVDPVELSLLVRKHLAFAEPQRNLFFRALDGIRAVADVSSNILYGLSAMFPFFLETGGRKLTMA